MNFIKPQLATPYDGIPSGKWLLEVKFDGYRMQINREKGRSRFFTRSGLNWLSKFSFIHEGLEQLPRDGRMTFYAFDVLHVDGQDLRPLPQVERKQILEKVLKKPVPGINYSGAPHWRCKEALRPGLQDEPRRAHRQKSNGAIPLRAQ